ncbi:glycoside hydrolase [uncultured Bacteroides sp.]|uniref:glycoside hydrolase n=1 Tax=uncultured Bacteroides sp. TaxID=162156 RepID=UPI003748BA30
MKMNILLFLSMLSLASCGNDGVDPSPTGDIDADITKSITVDASVTYQTIDGFAASDCWAPNYIGKYWVESEKDQIANLLFSKEIKNGAPQGIGLSMWRFNLGGGTAEQGIGSNIEDKSRRAECFLQQDGSLDWTHQQGQQYFLNKAKSLGCESFVMFSNTPPVNYTVNGKGYSAKGAFANLKDDCYDDFANYMATALSHFKDQGINFSFISPVNEPQYNWASPSQEGSGWQNSEIKRLTVELNRALTEKNLNTKILLAEAGDWEYLYKVKNEAERSDVINNFFNAGSANYVGDLTHVAPIIGGHSYWTDTNWSTLSNVRSQVATAATAKGLKVYQTEWSMMSDTYEDYPGHDNASYMDIALCMSKVIHHDLATANVSSWSYWTSMDVERWGHKNRFLLINTTPADGAYGDIEKSGTHEATKTLWTLGNYSLFIRPGYQRVNLTIQNSSNTFFGSAYLSPQKDRLVVVYTNLTAKVIGADLSLKGFTKQASSIKQYTTNASSDLAETTVTTKSCAIQPKSVVTVVYDFK